MKWLGVLGSGLVSLGVALCVSMPVASAAFLVIDGDGKQMGHAQRLKGGSSFDNVTLDISGYGCRPMDPGDFLIVDVNDNGTFVSQITSTTTPNLAVKSTNAKSAFVEWADGEETPIQKEFKVPSDYRVGGHFKVLVGRSGFGLSPAIDFEVFVDKDLTAFDVASTNQAAVQLDQTTIGDGSPDQITLTVTTDFDNLAANDWVTVNFWRDNTNTSTENLEFYGAEFCYNSTS